MSDELATRRSSSAAFCVESVARFDTVRKPPAARANPCAFPPVPQGKGYAMVNHNRSVVIRSGPPLVVRQGLPRSHAHRIIGVLTRGGRASQCPLWARRTCHGLFICLPDRSYVFRRPPPVAEFYP